MGYFKKHIKILKLNMEYGEFIFFIYGFPHA